LDFSFLWTLGHKWGMHMLTLHHSWGRFPHYSHLGGFEWSFRGLHIFLQKKQLELRICEIELENLVNQAQRQRTSSVAFEKAKMMQDFLRSGLDYIQAMRATLTFLGPST
jgi:hypothetical protein